MKQKCEIHGRRLSRNFGNEAYWWGLRLFACSVKSRVAASGLWGLEKQGLISY